MTRNSNAVERLGVLYTAGKSLFQRCFLLADVDRTVGVDVAADSCRSNPTISFGIA